MGRLIVYCDGCGGRIVEEDIDKGNATQAAGRYYCVNCKPADAPITPPKMPASGHGKTTAVKTSAVHKVSTSRHTARSTAVKRSASPLIVGAIVAGVAVTALIVLAVGGRGGGASSQDSSPTPEVTGGGGKPSPDPLAAQKKLVESVEEWARDHPNDHAEILRRAGDALQKVDASLRGRLEDVRTRAQSAQQQAGASKTVDDYLQRARDVAKADADFLRKSEVRGFLDEARRAGAGVAPLIDRVVAAETEYTRAFNDAAAKAWKTVSDAAEEIINKQSDPVAACRELEKFPLQFKEGEWERKLDQRAREYADRITRDVPKPPKSSLWEDFQRGMAFFARDGDYAQGARIVEDVLRRCNNADEVREAALSESQVREIATSGQYNIACYYARDQKDASTACRFLEFALRAGYSDWAHIDKDKDFDAVRASEPFKELDRKYRNRRVLGVEGNAGRLTVDGEEKGGLQVRRVTAGGVAEKGGVKEGDIILEVDKKPLALPDPMQSLRDILADVKEDANVPAVVLRGNQKVTLTLKWPKSKK